MRKYERQTVSTSGGKEVGGVPRRACNYESMRGANQIPILSMPEQLRAYVPSRQGGRAGGQIAPRGHAIVVVCIDDMLWLVRWVRDELRNGGAFLPASDLVNAAK